MSDIQRYFLLPGEIAYATERTIISTLLGSCVSVCLYDPVKKYGGLNHYMLPNQGEGGARLSKGKYGAYAIPRLFEMAEKAGSRRSDLIASVFGGGHVSGHLGSVAETGLYNISDRNSLKAETTLKEMGVKIVKRDTGGTTARKIHLDTQTGIIELNHVKKSESNQERARKITDLKGRKIGVLVVDDSAIVRRILKAAIQSTPDMEVIGEASNPYEAREEMLEKDPDVISLDIIMPRMDGLTFLKKLLRYKFIPTVVVSTVAKDNSPMAQNAVKAGAVGVIDKDSLSIYKGTDGLTKVYLPKLRMAATTVKT